MARKFHRFRGGEPESAGEINISSLIDIVFILLIFFIVTTVFRQETGVAIEKPKAMSQKELEKESILLGVTSQGDVYYGGREIGIGGVRSVVGRLLKQGEVPVIVQADRRTPTERTVAVYDEAKLAGAIRVYISTGAE